MFKVNNINGDQPETRARPTNVIGRASHLALQTYFGGGEKPRPSDDGEAIKAGLEVGINFLKGFSDGLIEYSDAIENRAKLDEKYAFAFFGYIKDMDFMKDVKEILLVEKMLEHKVIVDGETLPIPLKGSADLVYRHVDGKIRMRDHKFTGKYSDAESINGAKLIQAAFNYFLVYAELGEPPYSMIYEEFKITQNKDNSKQTRQFEIVFDEHPLIFDFFFRFYDDVTNALMGKQVYVPNLYAIFDREVSILAYIHRLDIDEEREKAFRKLKVENITDFLKKKIQKDGAMKKYLEAVSGKFVSASTLNYSSMTIEERIKMKLAEHGLPLEYHSKVEGGSFTLYRYEPSIGLKMSKIEKYGKDIEQVVETSGVRILAPIPDSGLVGFEIPNKKRLFPGKSSPTNSFEIPIGVNMLGETVHLDIREAPHVLIAGSTGSGKSVCMTNMIENVLSIPNSQVHLIDPKMVELSPFASRASSYNDTIEGTRARLAMAISEMESRYKTLQSKQVRKIEDLGEGEMQYMFIFIDEFADLIIQAKQMMEGSEIETMIVRLAQKGRAAGIHIVMATQRPSVNVVSALIKANFPTRLAFRTASVMDSMVIIDQPGAEKLLGKGDMLLSTPARNGLDRLQGFSN